MTNRKMSASCNGWNPRCKSLFEMFCKFFPLTWFVETCVCNTSVSLQGAGHQPTSHSEIFRYFGLWHLMATIVGFTLLWAVVSQTGLFGSLNSLVNSVIGGSGADIGAQLSLPRVLSFATTLAFFNIVLGTLLTGVCAIIFNVIGRITGGISVGFTNN